MDIMKIADVEFIIGNILHGHRMTSFHGQIIEQIL